MDEYDFYYYDDTRNATRDHRPQGGTVYAGSTRPGAVPVRPRAMAVVQTPAPAGVYRPPFVPAAPYYYPPVPPMMYPEQATAGSLLGRLTIGQVIEIAGQAYAALLSLPSPPNPQAETATNVQNLILYQAALAQHAKRDEQVRTLASLVSKLAA